MGDPPSPQICQPSPATDKSDTQLMLDEDVNTTPDGQCIPSYALPSIRN